MQFYLIARRGGQKKTDICERQIHNSRRHFFRNNYHAILTNDYATMLVVLWTLMLYLFHNS